MGAFDDLIPGNAKPAQGQPKKAGLFDDLVPAGGHETLESINARNRAYMASPQRGIDQQRQADWQAKEKKRQFGEMPAPLRALIGAGSSVGNATMGAGQAMGLTSEADVAAMREGNRFMEGDTAATLGRIGGDVALTAVPMAKLGKLAGATRAARYGSSALAGATVGALQPVARGESRGANTAWGGAFGFAGQVASDGLMMAGKASAKAVPEATRAIYNAAKARGINLTIPQLTDSALVKRVALMMDNLPLSGAASRNRTQSAAVSRQVAGLIGQKADVVDQSVMGKAYQEMGDEYDSIYAQGMRYDREFLKDIARIRRGADGGQMDETALGLANRIAGRVKKAGNGGELRGRTLQSIDQQARRGATGGGDRQIVASEIRDAIRRNMERTAGPNDAGAVRDLNRRYSAYKQIEPLVARSPEGITPQQLMGAVSTGRGASRMARGDAGELGELAMIGRRMQPARSSGSAENIAARDYRNPLAWPILGLESLVGMVGSRGLNSSTLAGLMMREGRGQGAQFIAPYLRPASVAAVPLATPKAKKAKDARKGP